MEKIYDNIFKTIVTKNSRLVIPIINEIFDENHDINSNVKLLSDHHVTEKNDLDDDSEIITDSYISIDGVNYHLECQSNPDGTIVFRMVEYDFHIALDDALRNNKKVIHFPKSAVLYLRHNKNTEDTMKLEIVLPDGKSFNYSVKIVKAKEITKTEIIEKKLYFLVPYYIMRVEEEPLNKVLDDYIDLLYAMKKDRENGILYEYDIKRVLKSLDRLTSVVYSGKSEILKGVEEVMGGVIIEEDFDKVYDEGVEKGIEKGKLEGKVEGIQEGIFSSIKNLMDSLNISADEAMNHLKVPENMRAEYLKKI